jgi:hypothetical protein
MTFLSAFVALAVLVGMVAAYPYQARYKDMDTTVDCHKFPAVISYHVHVTYMLTNDDQIAEASAFREATQKHFAPFLGEDPVCQGTAKDSSGRYGENCTSTLAHQDSHHLRIVNFSLGNFRQRQNLHDLRSQPHERHSGPVRRRRVE